ncbi:hypothetical protein C9374_002363 [Naegleria lovaniensis]|uniref:ribose-phosphate diphosphokinase n=1 Tax=Naegleria lovaniensis TaxID=51637 RepID=A0AA88KM67_NAELO|nr:uncharacterized protein C9374_002363 [Naegleria lovaniensis]KAG2386619.1 hypothetical protein C9374_002363 [Naegleria lovaniensis]
MGYDLKLISCSANEELANNISKYLDIKICKSKTVKFADGECFVQVNENVRGSDTFIVQSMSDPVNDNFMEMLLMIDALKRASVNRINVVITYYAYARQDRKTKSRVPISAALVAKLIESAGADHVICVDLHAGQIQGYFAIPVDNIGVRSVIFPALLKEVPDLWHRKITIVSPDAGGGSRADSFLQYLLSEYPDQFGDAQMAVMNKWKKFKSSEQECWNDFKQSTTSESSSSSNTNGTASNDVAVNSSNMPWIMELVGEVKGRDCIIVDDLVDTAGTLCSAAKCLKENGASKVYACVTHALLTGPALKRINETAELDLLVVSNSINHKQEIKDNPKIHVVDLGSLLGETIRRVHNDESLVRKDFLN